MMVECNSDGKIDSKNFPLSKKKPVALKRDTFRDDVRAEWIRAVFGTEFPQRRRIEKLETAAPAIATACDVNTVVKYKNNSWKGVGLAGISTYVAYTADLEVPLISASSTHHSKTLPSIVNSAAMAMNINSKSNKNTNETNHTTTTTIENNENEMCAKNENVSQKSSLLSKSQQPSLGMTLSRLPLGLYVRIVRPGSEAWCAGVEVNSVLIGINDGELNLLAEPSKAALERIWQYEGHCCAGVSEEENTLNNHKNEDRKQLIMTHTAKTKMKVRDPVSMTFIRDGQIYRVLFVGDPPYGIDWGPCGNFCLIQRVKPGSIAERAGVRPSSIVAGIDTGGNGKGCEVRDEEERCDKDKNTIFHLDHSSVASVLKQATSSCTNQQHKMKNGDENVKIRIKLCFSPSEARSGHWERQQDALDENRSSRGKSGGNITAINITKKTTSLPKHGLPRPRVAVELDGVKVRIHPFLGGRGSMISTGRSSYNSLRRSRSPISHRRNQRSYPGCFVPPSSPLSKLAERVAGGEILSIRRISDHFSQREMSDISSFSSSGADYCRFYRPCPILKISMSSSQIDKNSNQYSLTKQTSQTSSSPSILDCWDVQQAFIYIFRYHLAGYNELETKVRASKDTDFLEVFDKYRQNSQHIGKSRKYDIIETPLDVLSTFLIFWFGWLRTQERKQLKLTDYWLNLVHQNQMSANNNVKRPDGNSLQCESFSLVHRMEFLAGAFHNDYLKRSLRSARMERLQCLHLFANESQSMDDERICSENIHHLIPANTGTESICRNSSTSKGSKLDLTPDQRHATASVDIDSAVPVKQRSLRRFRLFHKKKRQKDKKTSSKESTAASVQSIMGSYPQMFSEETESVPSNNKAELSPEITSDENFSESTRSKASPFAFSNRKSSTMILRDLGNLDISQSTDFLLGNTLQFLEELELVCVDIEKSLMKSFSQKFARWALQPWSANKENILANVTNAMRKRLERFNENHSSLPLLDPINSSSEALSSIDTNGCYILPSAHFPLLLTFDCKRRYNKNQNSQFQSDKVNYTSTLFGEEYIYCTTVELIALKGSRVVKNNEKLIPRGFIVHGSICGSVVESQQSIGVDMDSNDHIWEKTNFMIFNSRSTWGPPQTLSLRLSEEIVESTEMERKLSNSTASRASKQKECGYCWVNLTPYWEQWIENYKTDAASSINERATCKVEVVAFDILRDFNEHGDLSDNSLRECMETIEIELQIRTKVLESKSTFKRSLLYKHDDDVRQEMFAIEFIKSCDRILRSCGLDMKMLIYECIPVGKRRGFIQWVQGSVPLSEICQPFAGSILARSCNKNKKSKSIRTENNAEEATDNENADEQEDDDNVTLSSVAKAGMAQYESLSRLRIGDKSSPKDSNTASNYVLPNNNNPIQDFLRSLAYDYDGSYKIKKEVMDTYVKSCAGYSVCTYILAVGDRHLDNLLLHESGHFFHCDYSFILGKDPKKYLPMRITQDMINGMGGWKSDNFCQFLSLACASFLTLRRPENVRHLLSLIRLLEGCGLPDLEKTQTIESAIKGVRDRLKLDLSDEEAIAFMEKLIQDSCSSKMWIAVDAIHSLAQRF